VLLPSDEIEWISGIGLGPLKYATHSMRRTKRAIADVASMSEQDYRAFGLNKGEILRELRQLLTAMPKSSGLPLSISAE
jgi:hypothetical protein